MHLLAQPPLRPDAHAITDNQHPDHQLGIDRGPSSLAVERPQMLADAGQIDEPVNRTEQMICRNMSLQVEAVEQRFLRHRTLAHHRLVSTCSQRIQSEQLNYFKAEFFNAIHPPADTQWRLCAS